MKSTIKGLKLSDIIAEIKKLDDMIVMHKKHTKDNLMSSQYEARKDKLFSELFYMNWQAPVSDRNTVILWLVN